MRKSKGFESLKVYQLSEQLADRVWSIVVEWDYFARDTIGKQIVRAADSVGANIAEGTGRGSFQDSLVRVARGSLYETIIDELAPRLHAYLRSIGEVH